MAQGTFTSNFVFPNLLFLTLFLEILVFFQAILVTWGINMVISVYYLNILFRFGIFVALKHENNHFKHVIIINLEARLSKTISRSRLELFVFCFSSLLPRIILRLTFFEFFVKGHHQILL